MLFRQMVKFIVFFLLTLLVLSKASFALDEVGKWKRYEVSYPNSSWSGNPFDLILDGIFTHTDSGKTMTVPGFYAGNNTWKIFFMPDELGEWTFITQSPDSGLDRKTGSFSCITSELPGQLIPAGNRWKLKDGGFTAPVLLQTFLFLREANGVNDFDEFLAFARDIMGGPIISHNFGWDWPGSDGSGTGDLWAVQGEEFNIPMFDRMNRRYDAMRDAGMGHYIMLYTDNNDNPNWTTSGQSTEEIRYFRYMVARFSAYPIVMWDSGTDIGEYRSDSWIDWFADWFNQNDPYNHPVSSRAGGGSGGKFPTNASYYSDGASNIPSHSRLVSDWISRGVPTCYTDLWRDTNGEARGRFDKHKIRRALWEVGLVGGTAASYGPDWRDGDLLRPYPETFFAGSYLGYAAKFFRDGISNFGSLDPHDELIISGNNVILSADPDKEYVAYLNTGGTVQIDLSAVSGTTPVEWYNPRTGVFSGETTITSGGIQSFTAPDTNDWVLHIGGVPSGPPDSTPPTTPQNVSANTQSENQINLTWQAASDPESGISKYNIYRNGSNVGQSTTTSFSDTGLNEGTTYNYEVSAINGAGLESAKSTSVSATTLADTNPPTISSVSASGDSTIVTIVFSESVEQASAINASNYQINNGITVVIASLGSDLKTVTITTSSHGEDIIYTLTVNNVKDRATNPNTIAPNTTASYQYVGMNTFDADSEGWAYFDDTFRSTTSPSSADGQWDAGGALSVALGGGTNNATSGGWAKSVSITESGLPISFDYKLDLLGGVDGGEYGEVIVSVDGNQVGILSNDFVAQLEGNGRAISTGWVTITVTAANVGVGSHEVIIGGYMSSKTSASKEKAVVYIDNVRISASAPIDTTPPAIPTGLTVE